MKRSRSGIRRQFRLCKMGAGNCSSALIKSPEGGQAKAKPWTKGLGRFCLKWKIVRKKKKVAKQLEGDGLGGVPIDTIKKLVRRTTVNGKNRVREQVQERNL